MEKKRESLQAKMERLRRSFLAELPERLDEIDTDFQGLVQQPNEPRFHKELHRKVHNIKGTAASFGLYELSQAAIKAESLLKRIQDGKVSTDDGLLANLRPMLQELREQTDIVTQSYTPSLQSFPAFELSTKGLGVEEIQQTPSIYICDDDPALLENLRTQLTCFAYTTRVFVQPKDMLEAIKQSPPDVIIMDIMFPDGEQVGIDCINQLNRLHDKKIPVIFISARNDFQARLNAVQANGAAYFTKPFKVMELVETLDSLLTPRSSEPHRILIIDDDTKIAEYHRLILQEAGMTVRIINRADIVLDVIFEFKPDLILVDMYMPLCNGRELAQLIRQLPEFLSMPIVYLSSETDAREQFSALRVGADGFLTKPIDPDRLISEVLLRTERMEAIRSLMVRDSLTGLLNHTTILNSLETAIITAKRRHDTLCFAMLDVDHFKQVNDSHGHAIGDQVLLALSRILKQRLRKSDFVGRYGGEEFAMVLTDVDLAGAVGIIDELREAFKKVTFNSEQGEFSCTLSGGVAAYPDFSSLQELINNADKALYIAKNAGRNRIEKLENE